MKTMKNEFVALYEYFDGFDKSILIKMIISDLTKKEKQEYLEIYNEILGNN